MRDICDRIGVVDNGKLVMIGTPEEAISLIMLLMKVIQMSEYISRKKGEDSYSFAFGDEIRQSILAPGNYPYCLFQFHTDSTN